MKPLALTATLGVTAISCGYWHGVTVQNSPQAPTVASIVPEPTDSGFGELWSLPGQHHQTTEVAPESFVSKMPEMRFDSYPAVRLSGPREDAAPGVIGDTLEGHGVIRQGVVLWGGSQAASQPVQPPEPEYLSDAWFKAQLNQTTGAVSPSTTLTFVPIVPVPHELKLTDQPEDTEPISGLDRKQLEQQYRQIVKELRAMGDGQSFPARIVECDAAGVVWGGVKNCVGTTTLVTPR